MEKQKIWMEKGDNLVRRLNMVKSAIKNQKKSEKNKNIDVTVAIVNWNSKEILRDCLNSLLKQTKDINYEIIISDNASTDGAQEMIEKEFPQVKLLKNEGNLGFAKANNRSIRIAKGKYVLLLNPDTIFIENSIKRIFDFMENNPEIGISGCQLLNKDKTIQPSAGYFYSIVKVMMWMTWLDRLPFFSNKAIHIKKTDFFTKKRETDWVMGAFFMIRKSVIERIGMLDEDFWMYVEETEFCYRAKQQGWKVVFNPETKLIHLGQVTLGKKVALLKEYNGLSILYKKHPELGSLKALKFWLKIGAILRIPLRPSVYIDALKEL